MQWFWEIVDEFATKDLAVLLQFVTGRWVWYMYVCLAGEFWMLPVIIPENIFFIYYI